MDQKRLGPLEKPIRRPEMCLSLMCVSVIQQLKYKKTKNNTYKKNKKRKVEKNKKKLKRREEKKIQKLLKKEKTKKLGRTGT